MHIGFVRYLFHTCESIEYSYIELYLENGLYYYNLFDKKIFIGGSLKNIKNKKNEWIIYDKQNNTHYTVLKKKFINNNKC